MPEQKSMLSKFAWNPCYRISSVDDVLTPALLLYPEIVASNIERMLELLRGDANRWRIHIKTAKLGSTVRMLIERGIRNFKCATTLELLVACRSGAADVLFAYPAVGANAGRVREIADQFPTARISVLVENEGQLKQWQRSSIGIFLDINPGMDRTGVEQHRSGKIVALARAAKEAGVEFRGLHYYDGQYGALEVNERTKAAHAGYDRLLELVSEIQRSGIGISEVITAGTATLPSSLNYQGFQGKEFTHRVSPGTVVYGDATSLAQLSWEYGLKPAALILTRIISQPRLGVVTCDAGHKAVSVDAGVPNCVVVGHPELTPLPPSEEHLPIAIASEAAGPKIGDLLYLLPRHVCPTVNNFDYALLVRDGRVESMERVSARGREAPLLQTLDKVCCPGQVVTE
jgi:D-serine deaminase-like pyridoxal phosphate-dependent protein